MTNNNLPKTTQEAFVSGQNACLLGKNIHYNPFRNRDNSINHLWDAWNRGWESQNSQAGPDYPMTNE